VVEGSRSLLDRPISPQALLGTIQLLAHPSHAAVDDLDAAIAGARMPMRDYDVFDS
jgi:hypothetical protein